MHYLSVTYQPVSLFSLKRSDATSMAARTNLVPTPYAIKMALLRVWLEQNGRDHVENLDAGVKPLFNLLRDLKIRVSPPEHLVVNRNGYKLRYYDQTADKADKTRQTMALQGGFVFREWIAYQGRLQIACEHQNPIAPLLTPLFAQINYFGKRGCFFQYLPTATIADTEPPPGFDAMDYDSAIAHPLDDLGPNTTFAKLNPYSDQRPKVGRDRLIHHHLLPLQLVAAGADYDWYRSVGADVQPLA